MEKYKLIMRDECNEEIVCGEFVFEYAPHISGKAKVVLFRTWSNAIEDNYKEMYPEARGFYMERSDRPCISIFESYYGEGFNE